MKKLEKKTFSNQNGQGVMEYVIISSLIGIFCLAAIKTFGTTVKNHIYKMKEEINKTLE